ncbi:MAG: S1 RNA-binding domain-containing protein [Caldisericia bacterium]|jgi:4-hydroxy-3-methylbut-2-enyl diphosphate reductase|nr:S1 RNA-binding domain-containing protein [Caldisericia bacterium]
MEDREERFLNNEEFEESMSEENEKEKEEEVEEEEESLGEEEIRNILSEMEKEEEEEEEENSNEELEEIKKITEDYLPRKFKKGEIIKAIVVKVEDDGALVSVGRKFETYIPLKELTKEKGVSAKDIVKEGEEIDVYVVRSEGPTGDLVLSKRRADYEKVWRELKEAYENKREIEGTVTRVVKGGLLIDLGLPAFLPRTQIELDIVKKKDLSNYLNKKLKVKIIEFDREIRKIIVSRRVILEEEKERERKEYFYQLKEKEGEIVVGTVVGIVEFGVFVDLGKGVEGLIHLSELTWGPRKPAREVVRKKQKIRVKILKVDPEEEKISLSLRQTKPHPWDNIEERYPVGTIVKGKVIRFLPFGAVIELEEGVTGLIHVSQISLKKIKKPEEALQIGQEVEAKVVELKPEDRKMRLSIKALFEEEIRRKVVQEKKIESEYIVDEEEVEKLKFLKG